MKVIIEFCIFNFAKFHVSNFEFFDQIFPKSIISGLKQKKVLSNSVNEN